MGMRILEGRALTDADAPPDPFAQKLGKLTNVVVNQAFVRRFFPDMDPLGKRFGNGAPGTVAKAGYVIVGVVSDAKYRPQREPLSPIYFIAGNLVGFFGAQHPYPRPS